MKGVQEGDTDGKEQVMGAMVIEKKSTALSSVSTVLIQSYAKRCGCTPLISAQSVAWE